MNRSSNVFNAAPLGSGGASGFVFAKAAQVCQATYTAVITVARGLRSSTSVAVNYTYKIAAGRKLKGSIQATATVWSKLLGYIAVPMTATLNATATGYARLTKWRQRFMASTLNASASVTASLRNFRKVSLEKAQSVIANCTAVLRRLTSQKLTASQLAQAQTAAVVKTITKKHLVSTQSVTASVQVSLRKGRRMSAVIGGIATTSGVLNESSGSRAPIDRIGYIQASDRVAIVPKGF